MVGKLEVHFAILQDLPCKFNFTIQLGFDMALNVAIWPLYAGTANFLVGKGNQHPSLI